MRKTISILAMTAPLVLSACSSFGDTFGFSKNPPDEFRVITKSPLYIPKDFTLRPPRTSESAQVAMNATNIARSTLTGLSLEEVKAISEGEKALLTKLGADKLTGNVRAELDNAANNTTDTNPSLVERLTFGLIGG